MPRYQPGRRTFWRKATNRAILYLFVGFCGVWTRAVALCRIAPAGTGDLA
jgi:hypothetical protein